jgi:alpha-L-fucosidase 2
MTTMKRLLFVVLSVAMAGVPVAYTQTAGNQITTAWHDGRFVIDTPGLVGRSDIVLGQPNLQAVQALPLGNGQVGVALWSADGLTAQLNRADAMPNRDSAGQLVIPGLSAVTSAADYSGRLDLYNGSFVERGAGMTVAAYVQPDTATLVVEVRGAKPDVVQTAQLRLWPPRTPKASVRGSVGTFAESWLDDKLPGASGRPFGSLAGITAQGRDISVTVSDPHTLQVSFRPYADGHFLIAVTAPHYDGHGDPQQLVQRALANTSPSAHKLWWNAFWRRADGFKVTSADGSGEYMENLRAIYLYAAAAEKGEEWPGSQAGVADMFSFVQDFHQWDPAAFWHWNLRMLVAANLGAGIPELNAPFFNLYRENLTNIEKWTTQHMDGLPGACVPETMRFNGAGMQNHDLPPSPNPRPQPKNRIPKSPTVALNCDAHFTPFYNARTLSTGAEVSLWIWQQYLATNDRDFLARNYPVIAASARFLLAYEKSGPDGMLHTEPSNAHETQWDVKDPTTDLAARRALYPVTIEAAKLLGKDRDLIPQLEAALPKIPSFPRTQKSPPFTVLSSSEGEGQDVIGNSYLPAAKQHNIENIGLEPVWPYNLIGDTSPLFDLARRTYRSRPYPTIADWSFDPIQSARLGLSDEVEKTLIKLTETYQIYPNGFAHWASDPDEFYIEQSAIVADALQEALVQDYDGLIRIAPAVPSDWDFDGSVSVRGKTRVDVQVKRGIIATVVIEAGSTGPIKLRNPWPGEAVKILAGSQRTPVRQSIVGPVLQFQGVAHTNYLVERENAPQSEFAPVSGVPATSARTLGPVHIGLPLTR